MVTRGFNLFIGIWHNIHRNWTMLPRNHVWKTCTHQTEKILSHQKIINLFRSVFHFLSLSLCDSWRFASGFCGRVTRLTICIRRNKWENFVRSEKHISQNITAFQLNCQVEISNVDSWRIQLQRCHIEQYTTHKAKMG